MQKSEFVTSLLEFHQTYGAVWNSQWTVPNEETRLLRYRLLEEELKEFISEAMAKEMNPVEVLDAVVDMIYIYFGTVIAFGMQDRIDIHPTEEYGEIYSSETNWTPLVFELSFKIIDEADDLLDTTDLEEIVVLLESIWNSIMMISDIYKLTPVIPAAFIEVHSSNMSKLGEDGKPIYREDGKILKGPNYFKPDLYKIYNAHFGTEYKPS